MSTENPFGQQKLTRAEEGTEGCLSDALSEKLDEIIERDFRYPITKRLVAELFQCDLDLVTEKDRTFFKVYSKIAIKQIMVARLFELFRDGNNIQRMPDSLDKYAERRLLRKTLINDKLMIFHDIAHSILALSRNKDKGNLISLTPAFLTPEYMTHLDQEYFVVAEQEEALVSFLFGDAFIFTTSRWQILESIDKSSSLKEFMKDICWDYPDPDEIIGTQGENKWFWEICQDVYNNYSDNPRYMLDFFIQTSTPIIEKYGSK